MMMLQVLGGRWGGGCTSGHGISGCAILMVHSFLAVPVMFGVGIAIAFVAEAVAPGSFALRN